MGNAVTSNIQNFWDFFGGNPDETMTCEHIPCVEMKDKIDALKVSYMVMPLMDYIQSDWKVEEHFVEFQTRNRSVLDEWQVILQERLNNLGESDPRILFRYDIITIPDTFRVDLRLAAIPTLRGVVLAAWTAIRFNDESKRPIMISPSISIYADEAKTGEADAAIIREALTDKPEIQGDAGRALAMMVEILNTPRILS